MGQQRVPPFDNLGMMLLTYKVQLPVPWVNALVALQVVRLEFLLSMALLPIY